MIQHRKDRQNAVEQMEVEMADSLRLFRSAITAVADRTMRQSGAPLEYARQRRLSWLQLGPRLSWAPALALLLLSIGLVIGGYEYRAGRSTPRAIAVQTPAPAAATNADDAALMTQIDEDLSQDAPASLAPLEVTTAQTTHRTNRQMENEANGLEE